ncbi:MAG TPA: dihydrolipoamide acetyltransferase family protein [Xanthobacteraceae bacterium]|nr:dihydrolipoamide acetyltransferase family protein [Xanthobacteraceae bacterium]
MDVLMPQLGETVAEGKVTKWFKSAGDKVAPGDNLFEIETDKVSMEVPATEAGVLAEVRVAAGEVAPVGAVVAVIAASGAAVVAAPGKAAAAPVAPARPAAPRAAATAVAPAPAHAPAAPIALDPFREVRTPERNYGPARLASGVAVSPLARRLAAQAGIDLESLSPSGAHGRILAHDVESAVGNRIVPAGKPAAGPSAQRVKALYEPGSYDEVPLDTMRRTIAARLTEAAQTIPTFQLSADVAIERLLAVREEANASAKKDADGNPAFKLSLNDFVIKAWALALQQVPAANAVWAQDRILRLRGSDIGIAVALDGGLITPLIRGAQKKSLADISAEMRDLAERARARHLKPHEYQGGASAISNLGMYGIREFNAIINPPHATILAVGAGERRPVETDDGFRFVTKMTVTLSCDHRVVDGALGAELVGAFKHYIEHPVGLMV